MGVSNGHARLAMEVSMFHLTRHSCRLDRSTLPCGLCMKNSERLDTTILVVLTLCLAYAIVQVLEQCWELDDELDVYRDARGMLNEDDSKWRGAYYLLRDFFTTRSGI